MSVWGPKPAQCLRKQICVDFGGILEPVCPFYIRQEELPFCYLHSLLHLGRPSKPVSSGELEPFPQKESELARLSDGFSAPTHGSDPCHLPPSSFSLFHCLVLHHWDSGPGPLKFYLYSGHLMPPVLKTLCGPHHP